MYSDWNHHWADVVQLLKTQLPPDQRDSPQETSEQDLHGVLGDQEPHWRSLERARNTYTHTHTHTHIHHGIEAHGVRDAEPVRKHFSPKGRHSRCTRLYRAYLDDFGGYPGSQEEPAESVRRVAGPSERTRVSATPAPIENVGGPSCATARYSHPSGIL